MAADFYSMDNQHSELVSDIPTYTLSIEIDGKGKQVGDYGGRGAGMPVAITDLEDEADAFARTDRWVDGSDGLVAALRAEKYDFKSFDAQIMLKRAAENSRAAAVRELLEAGVGL